jgi:predicted anti-sigma-YlaC factor YlaD
MTCEEMVQFLMDYLDGDLPADQRASFEEHLRYCPPCVCYLQTYQECIKLGKICIKEEETTVAVPEELVKAILAARKKT